MDSSATRIAYKKINLSIYDHWRMDTNLNDNIFIKEDGKYAIFSSFQFKQDTGNVYYRLNAHLIRRRVSTDTILKTYGSTNGLTETAYSSYQYYPFGYYRGRYGWDLETDFFNNW